MCLEVQSECYCLSQNMVNLKIYYFMSLTQNCETQSEEKNWIDYSKETQPLASGCRIDQLET